MIAAFFRGRRQARAARAEAVKASADRFLRFNDGDLHTAFWRAHDRMSDPGALADERRFWGALLDEIDRRRLPRPPRPDPAAGARGRDRPL